MITKTQTFSVGHRKFQVYGISKNNEFFITGLISSGAASKNKQLKNVIRLIKLWIYSMGYTNNQITYSPCNIDGRGQARQRLFEFLMKKYC